MMFMISSTALVQASSMDISDPTCIDTCTLDSTSFSFFADANGGGIQTFRNGTTQDWISLTITETGIAAFDAEGNPNIFLKTSLFTNTRLSAFGSDGALMEFFGTAGDCADDLNGLPDTDDVGLSETCGIAVDQVFSINLNPSFIGDTSWLANQRFDAIANVPEPASLFLLGAGLAGILGLKKKRA